MCSMMDSTNQQKMYHLPFVGLQQQLRKDSVSNRQTENVVVGHRFGDIGILEKLAS